MFGAIYKILLGIAMVVALGSLCVVYGSMSGVHFEWVPAEPVKIEDPNQPLIYSNFAYIPLEVSVSCSKKATIGKVVDILEQFQKERDVRIASWVLQRETSRNPFVDRYGIYVTFEPSKHVAE